MTGSSSTADKPSGCEAISGSSGSEVTDSEFPGPDRRADRAATTGAPERVQVLVMARPKSPLEVAESAALVRVANLASQVMVTLRKPGRTRYESERTLRGWLADDGVTYSASDVVYALGLLELTGRIHRGPAKTKSSRLGWLATDSDEVAGVSVTTSPYTAADEPVEAAARSSPGWIKTELFTIPKTYRPRCPCWRTMANTVMTSVPYRVCRTGFCDPSRISGRVRPSPSRTRYGRSYFAA
jgi:hypothetical protein